MAGAVTITADEAIALLGGYPIVHTYMGMFGADWDLPEAESTIRSALSLTLVDGMPRAMRHPLAVEDRPRHFVLMEVDMEKLDAFEAAKAAA